MSHKWDDDKHEWNTADYLLFIALFIFGFGALLALASTIH